ncbi:PsbP domain-containing protein 5, chloroplastic, partial [Linum perenne]
LDTADARLRIVSERVDFVDNLIISVTVTSHVYIQDIGPPNVQFIKSKDKSVWNAKDVADSVLSDKSTLVNYESRQVSDWLRVLFLMHIQPKLQVDGQPYWFYEYLVRKSPTKDVSSVQEYRHYVASTAERDGYLYSLSASTLNRQWGKMGPVLERSVSSFRLLPPTAEYVPPFKDPWRFW